MRRNWIVLSLATVVLIAAAAGALFLARNSAQKPQQARPVAQVSAPTELILPGTIQALEVVNVGTPIAGRVTAFHAEAGDEVYEGQYLAEVRNDLLEGAEQAAELELQRTQDRVNNLESVLAAARLEASRAQADSMRADSELEASRRTYDRQRLLYSEGATPRLTFEKAEREFRADEAESKQLAEVAARAEDRVSTLQRDLDTVRKLLDGKSADLEAARARVAAGQIIAPASGLIAARRGQVGDEVHPAMEDLFVIATDLSQLEVVLEPNPAQAAQIKPGQQAAVIVADVPNESLAGVVTAVEPGKVVVQFGNPSPLVKPGLTAQVRIKTG